MVDIEALDSAHTAAIISIGMVYFDLVKGALGPEFYVELSQEALQEQIDLGRTWSLSTTMWWMQQSDEARKVWANSEFKHSNKECLTKFTEFFSLFPEHGRNLKVWGNGSTYDNICLQSYFSTFRKQIPWNYRGDMCYRTVKNLLGHKVTIERVGTHHNGLDDSKTQALHLINMVKAGLK